MTLLALLLACLPPAADDDRPSRPPRDPPSDTDDATPTDSDDGASPGDTGPVPLVVESDGAELCLPGPSLAGDLCVPTVLAGAWGPDWDYPSSSDAQYAPPVRFLDLEALDAALAIAPSFVLAELAATRKGRFAVVPPAFVERLQAVRDDVGGPVNVNSGYRNPAYNAGVGGAELSRHQWGDAADLATDGVGLEELAAICLANDAGWVGIYETHVHCDWRDDPLDTVLFGPGEAVAAHAARPGATLVPGPAWTAPATGFDEGEPLRRWTATDAAGRVLATALGRAFTPPPGTARVAVTVGGRVTVARPLR